MKHVAIPIAIGALGLCAAIVAAEGLAAEASAAAGAQEIRVLTGGIGEEEQQRLMAREQEFNLKLVFSLVQGNYLADVAVILTDARGKRIVESQDTGPFFLARLPAGEYSITATHDGKAVSRKLRVLASRLRTEYLRWPANPEQDLPVSRWLDKE